MDGTVPEHIDREDEVSQYGSSNNSVHNEHSLPSTISESPPRPGILQDLWREIKHTKHLVSSLQGHAINPVSENSQNGPNNDLQHENDQLKAKLLSLGQELTCEALKTERLKGKHQKELGQKDAAMDALEERHQKAEREARDALMAHNPATAGIWQGFLEAAETKNRELLLQIEILDMKLLEKKDSHEVWKHKYVCFS